MDEYKDVYRAILLLSSWCDGATSIDGAGFSKYDVDFGKSLAARRFEQWTPKQLRAAWKMVRKYRAQLLLRAGLDITTVPEPPEVVQTQETRLISIKGEKIAITFPQDEAVQSEIHRLGGRWSKDDRAYLLPLLGDICRNVLAFAAQHRYWFAQGTEDILKSKIDEASQVFESSRAAESTFDVPGLKLPLRPFQRAGVEFLVRVKKAILADEVGLGKTPEALAAIYYEKAYPVLVACPKSVKGTWHQEALKFLPDIKPEEIVILNGRIKPEEIRELLEFRTMRQHLFDVAGSDDEETIRGLSDADYARIMSRFGRLYDEMIADRYGIDFAKSVADYQAKKQQLGHNGRIWNAKIIIVNYDILHQWKHILREIGYQAVIGDECHNLKSSQSQRAKAVRELAKGRDYIYLLSGSPMLNRPSELTSLLSILGVLESEWGGWQHFVTTYCGARQGPWGWEYGHFTSEQERAHAELALNRRLRETRYIRRVKRDRYDKNGKLLEKGVAQGELPPRQVSTVLVDIDNRTEYDKAEADVIKFIWHMAHEEERFLQTIAHLPEWEQEQQKHEYANSKAARASRAEHLARINLLRQLADKGKRYAVVELGKNLDDADEGYLVFGWFQDTVSSIAEALKMPYITGQTDEQSRERYRIAITEGRLKKLALNIRAGGIGLTLIGTKESPITHTIFGGLDWSPKMLDQAEGRIDRIGTGATMLNFWYVLGRDTIDEELWSLLNTKRASVGAATEGIEEDFDPDILTSITEWLKKKGEAKGMI